MLIEYTNRFKKAYKRLHSNQLADINNAIEAVIKNPEIGERKTGDLSRLWVYKFKMLGRLTLLGYTINNSGEVILTFIDFGPHENFYRDMKKK